MIDQKIVYQKTGKTKHSQYAYPKQFHFQKIETLKLQVEYITL